MKETPEMKLSKELHPVQSKKTYTEESKKLHQNVNFGSGTTYIMHNVHGSYIVI